MINKYKFGDWVRTEDGPGIVIGDYEDLIQVANRLPGSNSVDFYKPEEIQPRKQSLKSFMRQHNIKEAFKESDKIWCFMFSANGVSWSEVVPKYLQIDFPDVSPKDSLTINESWIDDHPTR